MGIKTDIIYKVVYNNLTIGSYSTNALGKDKAIEAARKHKNTFNKTMNVEAKIVKGIRKRIVKNL